MLKKVKLALRISSDAFNDEISGLIQSALSDLGVAGVLTFEEDDPLITQAVITYCKANFGQCEPGDYTRLKASYDEQKAQLQTADGYTDWGDL